jgi:hypothetical protein
VTLPYTTAGISPAPFAGAEHAAHQRIDDEFAELFIHRPVVNRPNFQAEPDPTAPPQAVMAVFIWEAADQRLGLAEVRVDSRTPCLIIDRYQLAIMPKRGDRFTRDCGKTEFEVTKVHPDGLSGLKVELVQLGVAY